MMNSQRTMSIIIGLLLLSISVGLLVSCGVFQEHPTAPVTVTQAMQFFAGRGVSDQVGVYYNGTSGFFQVNVPEAGDYLLTYTTQLGTFEMMFRTTGSALLTVGLQPGDTIIYASIRKGEATAVATKSAIQRLAATYAQGLVVVLVWPGEGGAASQWNFQTGSLGWLIELIVNGQIPEDAQVFILPKPAPFSPTTPSPGQVAQCPSAGVLWEGHCWYVGTEGHITRDCDEYGLVFDETIDDARNYFWSVHTLEQCVLLWESLRPGEQVGYSAANYAQPFPMSYCTVSDSSKSVTRVLAGPHLRDNHVGLVAVPCATP